METLLVSHSWRYQWINRIAGSAFRRYFEESLPLTRPLLHIEKFPFRIHFMYFEVYTFGLIKKKRTT